ncbi:MAG: hypothetical protein ACYTFI_11605 [Planctomycetota bacterium]
MTDAKALRRFWFEFETDDADAASLGLTLGCGVTARNREDALQLMAVRVFRDAMQPQIKRCIEDVDVRELDQNHVIPNMEPPDLRGIWYPMGNG